MIRFIEKVPWSMKMRVLVFVSLGLGIVLSWPLWVARTEIPLFPFLQMLCFLGPISAFMLAPMFVSMALLCFFPLHRGFFAVWLLSLFCIIVVDENRLLPWLIQYVVMFVVLCFDLDKPESFIRLVLGGIYFHSGFASLLGFHFVTMICLCLGLHKFNTAFAELIMPPLMEPIYAMFGLPELTGLSTFAGYTAPFIELCMGIFLVVKNKRVQTIGLLLVRKEQKKKKKKKKKRKRTRFERFLSCVG